MDTDYKFCVNEELKRKLLHLSGSLHNSEIPDEGFAEVPGHSSTTSTMDSTSTEPLRKRMKRYKKSRPRRRKGGKLHRVDGEQNRNNWRYNIGAPRNDNEFLLNQSFRGTNPAETSPVVFPYADSDDDETTTCPICHQVEPRKDSGVESEGETTSDYASSPNDRTNRHVCLPNEMSSLNIHSSSEYDAELVSGPDPSFIERNFEAEYEENMMRVLQDCSKDELVVKCRRLMEKVKDLEKKPQRPGSTTLTSFTSDCNNNLF